MRLPATKVTDVSAGIAAKILISSSLEAERADGIEIILLPLPLDNLGKSLNGKTSINCSHLNFGDPRRGWDFRSPGRGEVDFEEIIRALNEIEYTGPLSIEWEDSGMDREYGAKEACAFTNGLDFTPSDIQFDAAFDE